MRPRRLLPFAILCATGLLLLTGCGIGFGSEEKTTEMFRSLELSGDRLTNRELTLSVGLEAAYSVPVRIACYYENRAALTPEQRRLPFQERALLIGERVLEPVQAEHPSRDAPPQMIRFQFSVPRPGTYFLGCLTPAAPENGMSLSFEIRQAVDVTAGTR